MYRRSYRFVREEEEEKRDIYSKTKRKGMNCVAVWVRVGVYSAEVKEGVSFRVRKRKRTRRTVATHSGKSWKSLPVV